MPRKLSILLFVVLAVSTAWKLVARADGLGRADTPPTAPTPARHSVRNLHLLVAQVPGQDHMIRWSGVLDGFTPPPEGQYMDVACLVPTEPNAAIPERYDESKVKIAHANLGRAGEFTLCIPLYYVERQVRGSEHVRLRLVGPVALEDGPLAVFGAPTLAEDTVEVGDLPKLSDAMASINSGPCTNHRFYDPLLAIRSANALIRKGKAATLQALDSYLDIAAMPFPFGDLPMRPDSLDASDARKVIVLLHLIVEPTPPPDSLLKKAGDNSRMLEIGDHEYMDFVPAQGWHPLWWLCMVAGKCSEPGKYPGSDYPFVIEDGVPFFLPERMSNWNGSESQPGPHLVFFEKHGELRAKGVYRPTKTLGEILDAVSARIPSRKVELCSQALALLPEDAPGLPADVAKEAARIRAHDYGDAYMPTGCDAFEADELIDWLHKTPLVWDEKTEAFVKK
jgi:hypothetical protein